MIRTIDETISVAPQITPGDIASIAAAGFVAIINNRPDGEEMGQPEAEAIARAAQAAGLRYTAIPITHAGFAQAQVEAMAEVLAAADGPVLAFCRSGTRSCNLWALAKASTGGDPEELTAKAAGAGYDLSGLRPVLEQLSGRGVTKLYILGASLVAILLLALVARLLRLGGGRIADEAQAMAEAEAIVPGFEAERATVASDGQAALVHGRDGSVAVLKVHGARVAGRRLARLDAEPLAEGLRVRTGDARFGTVLVRGRDRAPVTRC